MGCGGARRKYTGGLTQLWVGTEPAKANTEVAVARHLHDERARVCVGLRRLSANLPLNATLPSRHNA